MPERTLLILLILNYIILCCEFVRGATSSLDPEIKSVPKPKKVLTHSKKKYQPPQEYL